jgi:glycosyltransferase involved in cell wall biosynthesis
VNPAVASVRRIALVNTYNHPARDSIERMLAGAFPEFQIENLTVLDIVKRHRSWIVPNMWHVAAEYGHDLARRRTTLRTAYLRTTYAFDKLHAAMKRLVNPDRHAFSFQMMSLYDTSVPGVPHFVYTDHTHLSNLRYADFDRSTLHSPRWIARERSLYENAAAVFTLSSNISADLTHFYGIKPSKVECVYAGSNVELPRDMPSNDARYAKRRILFVGNDWERKGGPDLLQAFRSVLKTYPDAHLTIAGAAVVTDIPNCTVLGHLSARELSRHYSEASVFCLPTRLEPFGIAFVEAMSHALPIVATSVGAVPDMVEEGVNGHLVAPRDPSALAQALIRVLRDPSYGTQLGLRGRERALERYTWAHAGARIRARVMRVLAEPRATPLELGALPKTA